MPRLFLRPFPRLLLCLGSLAILLVSSAASGEGYSPYAEDELPRNVYFGDTHIHSSWSADAGNMGNRRIDRIFRNISSHAEIIIVASFLWQASALFFHLIGSLPCPDQDLAHAAHGLAVRRNDREGSHVV